MGRSKETSLRGQKHLKSVSLVVDMMSFSQKIVIFALVLMLCYEIQAVPGPCWDWLCLRGCSFIRGKSEGYCDDDDNCMCKSTLKDALNDVTDDPEDAIDSGVDLLLPTPIFD